MFFLLGGNDKKARKAEKQTRASDATARVRDVFLAGRFPVVTTHQVEGRRIAKVLASPLERMLSRVHGDTDLDFEQRSMLYDALYRAFLLETGNDAKWLDALLAGEGLPIPAKP